MTEKIKTFCVNFLNSIGITEFEVNDLVVDNQYCIMIRIKIVNSSKETGGFYIKINQFEKDIVEKLLIYGVKDLVEQAKTDNFKLYVKKEE